MLNARLAQEWYTWHSGPGQGDRLQQRAPLLVPSVALFRRLAVGAGWCPRPLLNEIGVYLRAFLCHGASI